MGVGSQIKFELVEGWGAPPEGTSYRDAAGVAIDDNDRVYVLTRMRDGILVYERDGTLVHAWTNSALVRPHAITIAPDGVIYVADDGAHLVHIFNMAGDRVGQLGDGRPSDTGFDSNAPDFHTGIDTIRGGPPFNKPTKLGLGPNGDLYVSDGYGNCRIHQFSKNRDLITSWGDPGIGPGQFHLPHSVLIHPDGRVFVCDRENDRVQLFDLAGRFLAAWDHVHRPCDVAFDAAGNIYVAELARATDEASWVHGRPAEEWPSRVSILAPDGQLLSRFGTMPGWHPGNFVAAHGIAVDSQGDIYVAEVTYSFRGKRGLVPPDSHTLQKFSRVA